MHLDVAYGHKGVTLDVAEADVLPVRRAPQAAGLDEPAQAVRAALESPWHFPALRQALTPDDHVAIVLDEQLPRPAALLAPLLEHLAQAHVQPETVTVVCPTPSISQPWLEELPDAFEDIHIEIHDATDRDRLSYLATTQKGRRIYLNRSVVDADQVVVLGRRDYDPRTGYAGAETDLFPALSDAATIKEAENQLHRQAPGDTPWPWQREAAEVAWLLGAPFLLQIIEGPGSSVLHVLGGTLDSSAEGRRLLDAAWRVQIDAPADVVLASMTGDPARHGFDQVAHALANAARIVKRGGKIVLLTDSDPALGAAARVLREAEDSQQALGRLSQEGTNGRTAAFEWATAAEHAAIYLLSRLPADTAEELLTVPLQNAQEVQRLLTAGRSCVFLPDAHKTMATLTKNT